MNETVAFEELPRKVMGRCNLKKEVVDT